MQYLFRVKNNGGYKQATRHPWPSLIFALPFLAIYECGLLCLGGRRPEALRTGADTWLNWILQGVGLQQFYWTPAFIIVLLAGWTWTMRKSRPGDVVGLCTGMAVESIVYALALCGISRGLAALVEHISTHMAAGAGSETALQQIITYLGAGVYEEVLFRLVLFTLLLWICAHLRMPGRLCIFSAALASALLFAAAHHFGAHGEQFDYYAFGFRSLAGVYFAYLYYYRGFGIAAGSHAIYDVVVGILAM